MNSKNINPFYITGITEADGSFIIEKNKECYHYLCFVITQDIESSKI